MLQLRQWALAFGTGGAFGLLKSVKLDEADPAKKSSRRGGPDEEDKSDGRTR